MNIVKGVADLIRRTSGGQTGESIQGSSSGRFSPPSPKICFSEVGDEAVLHTLWEKYENAVDKAEKKKLFHVFLKQFLMVFEKWEPANASQLPEAALTTVPPMEYPLRVDDIIVGCSAGHPAEIILTLTEEITQLTSLVSELNTSVVRTGVDLPGNSTSLSITSEGLPLLNALTIITRSMHNCRVFEYYGGIQKLTALMKGAVVHLKSITSELSGDESLSSIFLDKTRLLQQILLYVVSIICGYIDLNTNLYEKAQLFSSHAEFFTPSWGASSNESSSGVEVPTETRLYWHQRAVVSVMEAGVLNWLVELLRVIRRLSMKEQRTDLSLQYLTLWTLHLALSNNPRGQNHFKSIGGLEVLLDGQGLPSINVLLLRNASHVGDERGENPLLKIFQLHVLSLTVLREAVFGNMNNLQFLCENGRIHKFANSFCSLSFLLQECEQNTKDLSVQDDCQIPVSDLENENHVKMERSFPLPADAAHSKLWNEYVVKLSEVLCSFIVAPENIKPHHVHTNTGRIGMPISAAYGELSIKWVMGVLLTVFPCIKACSNQKELPNHLRVFANVLQHCVLDAFTKVLVSSPVSLEIFREEGLWDLIFSENFFHFGPDSEEMAGECGSYNQGFPGQLDRNLSSTSISNQTKISSFEILQMEVISFVEFAATCNGTVDNLPEVSVLLDALEQCACHPDIAVVLAKSLLHILQLLPEKTIASFKSLSAVSRVLKVACIQAEECRRSGNMSPSLESKILPLHGGQRPNSEKMGQSWYACMDTCMGLFTKFFSIADDAGSLVLGDDQREKPAKTLSLSLSKERKMVSDSELTERLKEFLRNADLDKTTTGTVRRKLEEDFAIDLSDKKVFIREQVDLFLQNELDSGQKNGDNEHTHEYQKVNVENDGCDLQEEVQGDDEEKSNVKRGYSENKNEGKKRGGGFSKLCSLSPQLQEFIGVPHLARTEVVRQLWTYIREKNLQDPGDRRNINCDEPLQALFGVDSINMFQMNKALSRHIWPLDSEDVVSINSKQHAKQHKREREEEEEESNKKEKKQKGGNSGFLAPLQLSDALKKFLGTGESTLSRSDVVKRMWEYIKQNNLQDPSDKRRILCDVKLKELFDMDSFTGFTVPKLLSAHFVKA